MTGLPRSEEPTVKPLMGLSSFTEKDIDPDVQKAQTPQADASQVTAARSPVCQPAVPSPTAWTVPTT